MLITLVNKEKEVKDTTNGRLFLRFRFSSFFLLIRLMEERFIFLQQLRDGLILHFSSSFLAFEERDASPLVVYKQGKE